MGRPRKPRVDEAGKPLAYLPQYPSMSACSQLAGVPTEVLRKAKAQGCPAFRINGLVDFGDFIRWYFNRQAADAAQAASSEDPLHAMGWDERKKRADALYQEQKLSERQMQSIPLEVIEARDQRIGVKARLLLERLLVTEAPARVANRDIEAARVVLDAIAGEVCAAMVDGFSAKALAADIRAAAQREDDEGAEE